MRPRPSAVQHCLSCHTLTPVQHGVLHMQRWLHRGTAVQQELDLRYREMAGFPLSTDSPMKRPAKMLSPSDAPDIFPLKPYGSPPLPNISHNSSLHVLFAVKHSQSYMRPSCAGLRKPLDPLLKTCAKASNLIKPLT